MSVARASTASGSGPTYLCGFQRMLEGLLLEPEFVHAVLRRITDLCKLALGRYLDLVGPYIQIIKMGDDLGTQNGPQMSPKTYRQVIKPYHQELFAFIKERTDARIFLHTCGSVYRLLPDLIDAGVEILNPVQVSARDMDTQRLKAEFGDRLTFMGAIDTQQVLPFGSVEDVEARGGAPDRGPGPWWWLYPGPGPQRSGRRAAGESGRHVSSCPEGWALSVAGWSQRRHRRLGKESQWTRSAQP